MTPKRKWWMLAIGAMALLLVGGAVAWIRGVTSTATDAPLVETRTISLGAVDVTMTPLQLDEAGARFRVSLDTHSGSLDIKLPEDAQLRVGGAVAPPGTWDGPGPGGHHRQGTLQFAMSVTSGASVELHLSGLPGEAVGIWKAQ